MNIWTIEDALKTIRALQIGAVNFGYHICLGGGVLNHGSSKKDLDLYFLPYNNPSFKEDRPALIAWLEGMWGVGKSIVTSHEDQSQPNAKDKWILAPNADGTMVTVKNPEFNPFYVEPPQWLGEQVYKAKIKFIRPNGDRIDAFIL
jgi:hypothetical protein